MIKNDELFLKTKLPQVEVTKILINSLKQPIEYFTYNIRRYKVPVSLVLLCTEIDVSSQIKNSIRLSDVFIPIKIGDLHFNFIFLPFTEGSDSYSFIKNVEHTKLLNIKNFFYFQQLDPTIYDYYSFFNTYLYEIKKEENLF